MKTIGQIFRETREKRGLTLSEAAEAIRVKTSVIEDLEGDRFSRFPAAIYARGFIKLYAEYLRLDPAPLLVQFSAKLSGAPLSVSTGGEVQDREERIPSGSEPAETESKPKVPSGPELPLTIPSVSKGGNKVEKAEDAETGSVSSSSSSAGPDRERVELPPRVAPIEHFRVSPPVSPKLARPSPLKGLLRALGRLGRGVGEIGEATARVIRQWPWCLIRKVALAAVMILLVVWGMIWLGVAAVRKMKERPVRPTSVASSAGPMVPEPDPLYLPDPFPGR